MKLKLIKETSLHRAISLAIRYRMMNEPNLAVSICKDLLEVVPDNQEVLECMLLSYSDQFKTDSTTSLEFGLSIASRLTGEYSNYYFTGIVYERWAKSHFSEIACEEVYDWLIKAMDFYDKADDVKSHGDENAALHWNFCLRYIDDHPSLTLIREARKVGIDLNVP